MIALDFFLLPANWADAVHIRRAWRTSIQSAKKGEEKRSALYTWPRRTMIFSVLATTSAEVNNLKRKLYKNLHRVWGVPVWPDRTWLTATAAAEQPTLQVLSTANRAFEVGGLAVLLSGDQYEVGEIDAITATQITFKANLSGEWASGTEVYPMLQAMMSSHQKLKMFNNTVGEMQIEASEAFDEDIVHGVGVASGFPEYSGMSVFNIEPNWIEPVIVEYKHAYDLLQYLGKSYLSSSLDETSVQLQARYLATSRTELATINDFFDTCKGRWGHFWVPSWQRDVVVTLGFLATAETLVIQSIEWADYWEPNETTGHHIFMRFPDGTEVIREIIAAPTATEITLSSAVGKACNIDDLKGLHVSFLLYARFDQDEIDISYACETVSEVDLRFATVQEQTE